MPSAEFLAMNIFFFAQERGITLYCLRVSLIISAIVFNNKLVLTTFHPRLQGQGNGKVNV